MKKLEGILTIIGVFLIIGMPLFLLFADTKAISTNAYDNETIQVMSFDSTLRNDQIDSNFYQSYETLDGIIIRDENILMELESEPPLNNDININNKIYENSIDNTDIIDDEKNNHVEIIDTYIPLTLDDEENIELNQSGININEETVNIDFELMASAIEGDLIDIPKPLIIDDDQTALMVESNENKYENESNNTIDITEVKIPEGVLIAASEETFGDIEENTFDEYKNENENSDDNILETIEDEKLPQALQELDNNNVNIELVNDEFAIYRVSYDVQTYDNQGNLTIEHVEFYY